MDYIEKDKLDIMIQLVGSSLIEHNLEVGLNEEKVEASFPKKLYRKIMRMIRHESGKPVYNDLVYRLNRAAVAILVSCSLCFTLAMSVGAVREALWDAVVEWFDEYIAVIFMPEVKPLKDIKEYKEPQLVPVGCEKRGSLSTSGLYSVSYYSNNKKVLKYSQIIISRTDARYDNEIKEFIPNAVHGYDAFLIEYPNKIILIWNDELYYYELTSYHNNLSIEKMRIIAESIY